MLLLIAFVPQTKGNASLPLTVLRPRGKIEAAFAGGFDDFGFACIAGLCPSADFFEGAETATANLAGGVELANADTGGGNKRSHGGYQ